MKDYIQFVCFCHPEPQGSAKGFAFQRNNGKLGVSITSDNSKLKPYRHAVAQVASIAVRDIGESLPMAPKHEAVMLELDFYFQKPDSVSKKRFFPVVKPDIDKLARSTFDALTGILFADDAQVVEVKVRKYYGTPERVEVIMRPAAEEIGKMAGELFASYGNRTTPESVEEEAF
jgi:Holliday junction resolvase RusA-like endonuclease